MRPFPKREPVEVQPKDKLAEAERAADDVSPTLREESTLRTRKQATVVPPPEPAVAPSVGSMAAEAEQGAAVDELPQKLPTNPSPPYPAEAAFTHARYRDNGPEGDHIPGSVGTVLNTGPTFSSLAASTGPSARATSARARGPKTTAFAPPTRASAI